MAIFSNLKTPMRDKDNEREKKQNKSIEYLKESSFFLLHLIADIFLPKDERVLELEAMFLDEIYSQIDFPDRMKEKWIFSLFSYSNPLVRELIKELKYSGNRIIAEKLSNLMYDFILAELEHLSYFDNFTKPVLIPIPLHRERLFNRGFNQCEIVCEELVKLDKNINFTYTPTLLKKSTRTIPQSLTKNKKERIKNLQGCFEISTHIQNNQNIILIDDVTTTGSTLKVAREILLKSGAKKVYAFTLAH